MEFVKGKGRHYPFYMYHEDYNEPRRVDENSQQVDLENEGWVAHYIHKDYPQLVNGVMVHSKEEHEKLLLPKVKKATLDQNSDGTGEPIDTLICEVEGCGRLCKTKAGLKAHMRVHQGD